MSGLRVAVQERQRLLREGLALFMRTEPDLELVGTATSAGDLARLCEERRPNVVVLEADAPDWDPLRLAAALRKRRRSLRVVGTYQSLDRSSALRAYQAGVHALVPRSHGVSALLDALRAGPARSTISLLPSAPAQSTPKGTLTARETEVLSLISAGWTTTEISGNLGISPKTVENHKQRIFTKLGVQSQAHAVAVAMRTGLLATPAAAPVARPQIIAGRIG